VGPPRKKQVSFRQRNAVREHAVVDLFAGFHARNSCPGGKTLNILNQKIASPGFSSFFSLNHGVFHRVFRLA
jgi:hypothetical protein